MIPTGFVGQKIDEGCQSGQAVLPGDEVAIDTHQNRHNAKTRAARRDNIARRIAFPRHARYGVAEIPKVCKRLFLNEVEQGVIADAWELVGAVKSGRKVDC